MRPKPPPAVRLSGDRNTRFAASAYDWETRHGRTIKEGAFPLIIQVGPAQRELEAESVSYLVCRRNGVDSRADQYLADYVQQHTTVEAMDLDAILRSAGQIEGVLRLGGLTSFGPREKPPLDEVW